MAFRIIDTHAHVISHDTARYPLAPLGGKRSTWSADHPANLDELIANLDAAGVDKAVVVQSSTTYGFDNSYVADTIAEYPERLTGVFSIDVTAEDAPSKIDELQARGFTGMRFFLRGTSMTQSWVAFDDPRAFPAWERCASLGMPVATNVKLDPAGKAQLSNILEQFPTVKVVLDHLALPDIEDGYPYNAATPLWEFARFPNLYLKACSKNFRLAREGRSTPSDFFRRVFEVFGPERVAWGSNYPAEEESLPELLEMCTSAIADLPEQQRAWLFEQTALDLYPVLAG